MRRILPNRRPSRVMPLDWINHEGKLLAKVFVTMGFHEMPVNGHKQLVLAEVFVNGGKEGTQFQSMFRDSAILISIGLQHGVPLTTLRRSVSREQNGHPQSFIGTLLDALDAELTDDEKQRIDPIGIWWSGDEYGNVPHQVPPSAA